MARPAKCSCRQGLLLVEAALCAVVIAVGLVFISRALGSQLRALQSIQNYDVLLGLAESQLDELEGHRLIRHLPSAPRRGSFAQPYQDYEWAIEATPRFGAGDLVGADDQPLTSDVVLTVRRVGSSGQVLTIHAIWPSEWVTP